MVGHDHQTGWRMQGAERERKIHSRDRDNPILWRRAVFSYVTIAKLLPSCPSGQATSSKYQRQNLALHHIPNPTSPFFSTMPTASVNVILHRSIQQKTNLHIIELPILLTGAKTFFRPLRFSSPRVLLCDWTGSGSNTSFDPPSFMAATTCLHIRDWKDLRKKEQKGIKGMADNLNKCCVNLHKLPGNRTEFPQFYALYRGKKANGTITQLA